LLAPAGLLIHILLLGIRTKIGQTYDPMDLRLFSRHLAEFLAYFLLSYHEASDKKIFPDWIKKQIDVADNMLITV